MEGLNADAAGSKYEHPVQMYGLGLASNLQQAIIRNLIIDPWIPGSDRYPVLELWWKGLDARLRCNIILVVGLAHASGLLSLRTGTYEFKVGDYISVHQVKV